MRILSLLWGFSLGGAGKCALTYDRLHEVSDIEMHTACIQLTNSNCDLDPLEKIGATLISIDGRLDLSWINKSIALIKQYDPDVLFVHGFNGPVVARILQWKLKRKLPFVCSYHGLYYPPKPSRRLIAPFLNFMMLRIFKYNAMEILAVSEFSKRVLVQRGVSAAKISTFHNGIETKVIPDNTVEGVVSIGVVTRLDPFKGLDDILEAFANLEIEENVELIIVGDGPYKKALEERCNKLDISNKVIFTGYCSDADFYLGKFDIFVLPSLFENHSIALLEAMRAGKAIIATNVGGNTESVRDGKEALIVPAKDRIALANALNTLIADSSLRERLSKAARQRFETEFTEEVILGKLADWFRSMEFSKE